MNGNQRREAERQIRAAMRERGMTGKDAPEHVKALFARVGIDLNEYETIPDFETEVHKRFG